jgi:hypothetical protein
MGGSVLVGRDHVAGAGSVPRISGFYAQLDALPASARASVKQVTVGLSATMYVTEVRGGRRSVEFSGREDGPSGTNGGALTLMLAF